MHEVVVSGQKEENEAGEFVVRVKMIMALQLIDCLSGFEYLVVQLLIFGTFSSCSCSCNLKGEPSFHLFGFILCLAATAARAIKSVLQGILLSSEGEKLHSMNLLMYMAPVAVVVLIPPAMYMEREVIGITIALARDDGRFIFFMLFNSALAYFVNLTNFLVTKHTSALTLQALGNAKGAVAVVISILI